MAPSLQTIPPELFREIVASLLPPDQANLSRTCKAIHRNVTPLLWSEIELHHRGTHEGVNMENEDEMYELFEDDEESDEDCDLPGQTHDATLHAKYPYKNCILEPSARKYGQPEFHEDPARWIERVRFGRQPAKEISCPRSRLSENSNRRNYQFGREELFVSVRGWSSRDRWADLAQHVRSLCISIGVDNEVAEVIGSFPNLTSLELIGLPCNNGHSALAPDIHLPKLQNLKLRGYLSSAFVRKVCNNAKHINHLDIGLLATPKDDEAYKKTLLVENDDTTPVSEEQAENFQKNGSEVAALAKIARIAKKDSSDNGDSDEGSDEGSDEDSDEDEGSDDEDDEDDEEEYDEFDEEDERQFPWALHSPIWLPRTLPPKLTSITHLHLTKPYTGETNLGCLGTDRFKDIPHRYEQVLCLEWAALLKGVAATLKELILEHRVPQNVGDTVNDGDSWPETKGSYRREAFFHGTQNPDRGDVIFCQSVLPLLLEQSRSFTSLRRLALRGIQVKGISTRADAVDTPGQNGVRDNDELLQEAYPGCDIEIFEEAYAIHVYAGSIYECWSPHRHEAAQDQSDGLLHDDSFFNDYKMRFGPQWKIVD
ncbi:hypothetical protein G7054_g520 [Neopestalotiopsis clavispora]|nr:hypothetical protein G7054_g520 [Neopestalotiopsis clavispora]